MNEQVAFGLKGRNPDVLSCIANLSNDEVFTPPEFANRMLKTLEQAWAASNGGASIWADKTVTFLDPFTKSGVFLREISTRLIAGLEGQIPDLQERVDHILTKQVFGIATTRITSLLARRSLYCSKHAAGPHSVTRSFGDNDDGNIWFERTEHVREGDRCRFCGASGELLRRGADEENYAYAFIHTDNIKVRLGELFGGKMQFDVIIGNPPYQLDDGGHGTSAAPIYQKFVEQAKALEPRFLTMVIPSRWFSGGKGLDDFRESMLKDDRLRTIDDFLSAADVFPGVGLKGGVSYFLWDRENPGPCKVTTRFQGWDDSTATRPLLEEGAEIFIRFNEGLSILRKVIAHETGQRVSLALPDEKRFDKLVSSARVFGFRTFFKGKPRKSPGDLTIYQNGGIGYVRPEQVTSGQHLIDKWKLFAGYAAPGTGNKDTYPHRIISTPFVVGPGTVSSETYLSIGPFETKQEAESALSYLSCRLTRLLILLHKSSQHVTRKVYTFVPTQEWNRRWTDAELYEKYRLTDEEIAFIEKIVRPMDVFSDLLGDVVVDDDPDA
ncbi:Eco57I restriction-modification methylase domain-containing protein [Porphyrobacter sp. CACIAM 03H1]|uniref:Eco57I restriction-modification methylase domain-containing protein n=1 Tax=Porphyrobacter sp. CACIAM 03H1 TaxID=2003315 RepID=UPI000B5A7B2B|nr:Eco57I restriction-modification methylase domain-containing protein [Porphyrobacter sp. CACIAM 03H1]ASJ89535.1 restriction endonuclease [Porphyrobacter sp. CACIAM 03H1]